MSKEIFISICIPAYKNVDFLKRLLDSITIQTYSHFEVIICDDSPDESVSDFVKSYTAVNNVTYHRNDPSLGTPANWNECIRRAKGEWVKIMHDDDWFANADSLLKYVDAINKNPSVDFIYSSYYSVSPNNNRQLSRHFRWREKMMHENPYTLISTNIIGPPSAVIYKNDPRFEFDRKFKWLVDIEFYARYLSAHKSLYLPHPLINIGLNEFQVTKQSSLVREIEIPEYFQFFSKAGFKQLNNIMVYDAWWRLFRNLKIKSAADIEQSGYKGLIDPKLLSIIKFQSVFPQLLLKSGVFSKVLMFVHFTFNR
jgi:glycosyltransferase involved in cell wall biosynthesis